MTETIRSVMAVQGLYPDLISNSMRVQDVYGDSRSYCVKCGRTWTSHVTWIKLDLRSQRVLKNWKQSCLDCGQEVSPYITSEELERMVTIAVERCLELIDEQKKLGEMPGTPSATPKRRRSTEKIHDGEQGLSLPGSDRASSSGKAGMPSPNWKANDFALNHRRPRPPAVYQMPLTNLPNQVNMQAKQMPIYTTGLVPVHVYYDGSWPGAVPQYSTATQQMTYIPTLPDPDQALPPAMWATPMPTVCCP